MLRRFFFCLPEKIRNHRLILRSDFLRSSRNSRAQKRGLKFMDCFFHSFLPIFIPLPFLSQLCFHSSSNFFHFLPSFPLPTLLKQKTRFSASRTIPLSACKSHGRRPTYYEIRYDKALIINRQIQNLGSQPTPVQVNDNVVNSVTSFIYLGSLQSSD